MSNKKSIVAITASIKEVKKGCSVGERFGQEKEKLKKKAVEEVFIGDNDKILQKAFWEKTW